MYAIVYPEIAPAYEKIGPGPGPGARYPLIWGRTASGPWALSRACPETQAVPTHAHTHTHAHAHTHTHG